MRQENLSMSLRYVKGVGPKIYERLEKKGLRTVKDALYFFPKDYQDRRFITKIGDMKKEGTYLFAGKISRANEIRFFSGGRCFEVFMEDETGGTCLKWLNYNPKRWKSIYGEGRKILVYGSAKYFQGRMEFLHPEVTFPDAGGEFPRHDRGIISPVYSDIEGIHQKIVRKIILTAVQSHADSLIDPLPESILRREDLPPLAVSLRSIHLPEGSSDVEELRNYRTAYHRRIIFDEFFSLQLGLARKKYLGCRERGVEISWDRNIVDEIKKRLPFQLTGAQRTAVNDILKDMKKKEPMQRLLQGDVGSGKTIVAWIASMVAWHRGYQVAVMAPTEILAEQHFKNFKELSNGLALNIGLLTASVTGKEKTRIKEDIASGRINIVVGTHAIIQEDVSFHNLALVIVDEQHRFGVYQRLKMRLKGQSPHMLVMTATPIPRTLAMTLYGDLDVSVIDEMPPGRTPVETRLIYEWQRDELYEFIRQEVAKGGQAFIVYPLVEESEKIDLRAAKEMYGHLKRDIFTDFGVELIHGKIKGGEKERIVGGFRNGSVSILVSTTVIEVGIDVPSANIMVIEHPERFGLSQLHQLRGRVGRGRKKSYCFLVAGKKESEDAKRRLEVMVRTTDGFKVAEEDLLIRGPGEFIGTRQSGLPDLIFGNIIRDSRVLKNARELAFEIIAEDPELGRQENRELRSFVSSMWGGRIDFAFV
ncbi:MAG: ATP-dependent DNA helicase RecG [Deltaproteobacteria bacterium]|nr:ATP-dependent DNA helicase RecG [Deltaproteobacteria bacterium]NIS76963.1 ATP-dependent DNA helicase RecG [Deltaproteobacteria bacterium]